jgi:hypothetical protein
MGWVKLDDAFLNNPKVMLAGLNGRALFLAGLCFSSSGLTDGFIPRTAVAKLAALSDVARPTTATQRLLAVGLWEEVPGGFRIHDYLVYQPSAESVRKDREAARERMAKHRFGGSSPEQTAKLPPQFARSSPSPSRPVPSPISPNGDTPPTPPDEQGGVTVSRRGRRRFETEYDLTPTVGPEDALHLGCPEHTDGWCSSCAVCLSRRDVHLAEAQRVLARVSGIAS